MRRLEGGICVVPGVLASGARQGKYGLAMIAASGVAVGVFTSNKIRAAPLDLTAKNLEAGRLDGVIANSGCANCYTGAQGRKDAEEMARMMADFLKTDPGSIGVASTGVIGRPMDMEIIRSLFQDAKANLRSSPQASKDAARAVMTTDTKVKEIAVENLGVHVAGIVKGAGMIEPDMATMLSFIYTDADLPRSALKDCLVKAVDNSFNMLTVDGDTSTNDTVLLTATGERKCEIAPFQEALNEVCIELARMMAKDGEGATKYFETVVTCAANEMDAKAAARSVVRSNLVKTAIYGSDPNWGRIVAAVGRSGAFVDPERITLRIEGDCGNLALVERGRIVDGVLDRAEMIMKGKEIIIHIDLGLGEAAARSFGCDLTHGYVDINANYTT